MNKKENSILNQHKCSQSNGSCRSLSQRTPMETLRMTGTSTRTEGVTQETPKERVCQQSPSSAQRTPPLKLTKSTPQQKQEELLIGHSRGQKTKKERRKDELPKKRRSNEENQTPKLENSSDTPDMKTTPQIQWQNKILPTAQRSTTLLRQFPQETQTSLAETASFPAINTEVKMMWDWIETKPKGKRKIQPSEAQALQITAYKAQTDSHGILNLLLALSELPEVNSLISKMWNLVKEDQLEHHEKQRILRMLNLTMPPNKMLVLERRQGSQQWDLKLDERQNPGLTTSHPHPHQHPRFLSPLYYELPRQPPVHLVQPSTPHPPSREEDDKEQEKEQQDNLDYRRILLLINKTSE
ncbi:hypothetical protein F4861DRAFT_539207 [Xylaria intraflava]|nr:hypothetical protein F4861DRAFT_539207 [Xylaria intraflava]